MKKIPNKEAWIPMADYVHHGVRKPQSRPVYHFGKTPAPLPETWVSLEDYTLHDIRKFHIPTNESFISRLKPPPAQAEIPKEAYLTIFDALQEVWAMPKPNGAVFSRLNSIRATDQTEWAAGRIPAEELERRQKTVDAIRTQFAAQAEEATEWFLNNRFRLFDTLPNA
ncbi:MAG: hypothetical protein HQL94_05050 [Magnetococcales bacterium]|nr:hypothetical protein [Magnetococcales bacterium]